MKQTMLALLALAVSSPIWSQETVAQRKNDVVADPILLIAAPMLNISYERLLAENQGVGLNVMMLLGDEENFSQFSAYYRMYFGKKYGAGFFIEGFVPVSHDEVYRYWHIYDPNTGNYVRRDETRETFTTVGVGFGVGGKWVMKNNLVFEISGGLARRFGSDAENDLSEVTGKAMFGIGYRF